MLAKTNCTRAPKRRRFINGLIEGKSMRRAALDAGYTQSMANDAGRKILPGARAEFQAELGKIELLPGLPGEFQQALAKRGLDAGGSESSKQKSPVENRRTEPPSPKPESERSSAQISSVNQALTAVKHDDRLHLRLSEKLANAVSFLARRRGMRLEAFLIEVIDGYVAGLRLTVVNRSSVVNRSFNVPAQPLSI